MYIVHALIQRNFNSVTALVNILDANDKISVVGGSFNVHIRNGLPVVYTPSAEEKGYKILYASATILHVLR